MFRRGAPCEVCHLWACKCEHPQIPTIEDTAAECETAEVERRTLEHVEADIRVKMAVHAAITPRGFDTIRRRSDLHKQIDRLLDEWHMLADVEAVTS